MDCCDPDEGPTGKESCFDKNGQADSYNLTFEKCCNTETINSPVVDARDRQQINLLRYKGNNPEPPKQIPRCGNLENGIEYCRNLTRIVNKWK